MNKDHRTQPRERTNPRDPRDPRTRSSAAPRSPQPRSPQPRARAVPATGSAADIERRKRRAAEGAPVSPARPVSAKRAKQLYPDDAYYRRPGAHKQPKKPTKKRRRKRPSFGRVLRNMTIAVVLALAFGALTNRFVFEIVQVQGDAMHNAYGTLKPGDWVVVTKYDYWQAAPAQGDIVAVSGPQGTMLRRVIALPGQQVSIDANGDTLIDGNPLGERYVALKDYESFQEEPLAFGRYFVLSDNRTVKYDSRSPEIGPISKQQIIGKARTVLWPLFRSGTIQ